MPTSRRTLLKTSAAAAAAFSLDWTRAQAQAETVRIGLIYDLTGPFAAGGSVASSIGAQIAIDLVNEKGGVGGKYKVAAVSADSQSKPEVAINEAVRLIDQEKIDIINGVYASSHEVLARGQGRAAEKDPLDHDRGFDRRVQGQEPAICLPRADYFDQYGQAFAGFISEGAPRRNSAWSPRTSRSRLFTRMVPMASASPPPMRLIPRRPAFRSCSRKAIRRPRRTFRCW